MNPVQIIGVGVQKAGTSWLFRCLEQHPDVVTASVGFNKELNFFNHNYENGYPWYHARFPETAGVRCEFSPLYFHATDVPARIARYNPEARLLVSLRNPVDRAISQHIHDVRRGVIDASVDFATALEGNPSYVEQGRYAEHLRRFLDHFDRSQILVLVYDDLAARPDAIVSEVYSFAGIDPLFVPERLHDRVNGSSVYRSATLGRLSLRAGEAIRALSGHRGADLVRRTGVPRMVRRFNEVRPAKVVMSPRARALLSNALEGDIVRLGEMLGRDLTPWLEGAVEGDLREAAAVSGGSAVPP